MDTLYRNITNFFEDLLDDLECQRDTKAYIIGVMGKYKNTDLDFSKNSLTLLFCQAREKQDFLTYQNLGDWLFYSKSIFPESLKNASNTYYDNIAQLSYYKCYRITKTWKVYEELADRYSFLTEQTRNIFNTNLFNHRYNYIR